MCLKKVIVFGLFEIIKKKMSEDRVPGSGLNLWVGLGTVVMTRTK